LPCSSVDPIPDADVTFPVNFNGTSYQVYVRKRPYLDRFLQWIAGRFEVTIFTASQQVYAERLLNLLDPEGKYINHRLYRDSCLNFDGNYLKVSSSSTSGPSSSV
jgi:CTD small phosphatase-like protein 2